MARTAASVERGIIPKERAGPAARCVAFTMDQAARPGGKCPTDVLHTA